MKNRMLVVIFALLTAAMLLGCANTAKKEIDQQKALYDKELQENAEEELAEEEEVEAQPSDDGEDEIEAEDWCPTGQVFDMGSGMTKSVTGVEEVDVYGTSVELCCSELETVSRGVTSQGRHCENFDKTYSLQWKTSESGDELKVKEIYPNGDQQCTRDFDENGEMLFEDGCE